MNLGETKTSFAERHQLEGESRRLVRRDLAFPMPYAADVQREVSKFNYRE
jgi:hypothetical protein